jgi:hypothetical protein
MFRNIWRNKVGLVVLLAMVAIILAACCTDDVHLEVINDTPTCGGGGCAITVTYRGGNPFCIASVRVPAGQSRFIDISTGQYTFTATGTCFNLTGDVNFPTPGGWWQRFFCILGAPQAPQFELGR